MKNSGLVNFNPIETVIQLRDADKSDEALALVKSYVISDEMSERLVALVFKHLQFNKPVDNKGLLIVGNYGTGKSHLLSIISCIAEDNKSVDFITNEKVKEEAKNIAGKFKVIRSEIGASTMSLSEIILSEIEDRLSSFGIDYEFPNADKIKSYKSVLEDMESHFLEKYPNHGLLIVVDELLDFLRTRRDQELILDLNFLREVGEYSKNSRFRFIAGVQEAIFDSPTFAFVANSLIRVRDRFEQVLIARNDIKYVVSERLLSKNSKQRAFIKNHLQKFTHFYSNMNEKLDEFVSLFPVHPDYISTFERIHIAEKREVLKSISENIRTILDNEVTEELPHIISYDAYWDLLRQNPSFRAIPDIRAVIECNQVLESRVESAFSRPHYKAIALRLIKALSIHRLTIGDIYSPIGITAKELRDQLCLFEPIVAEMGSNEQEQDLQTHIETVLREIIKSVNGQFISFNPENGQYYLDLKKTEDYDEIISNKVDSIDDNLLDRYYYSILRRVMECSDNPYVTGYKIWQHELEWTERKASRTGYLFFGSPNERSTAVPQREFYLYFIQIKESNGKLNKFKNEKHDDEVFFELKGIDSEFEDNLKRYCASAELANSSTGHAKSAYESKAKSYSGVLFQWMQKNIITAFEITYQGISKPLLEWTKGQSLREISGIASNQTINFRDTINTLSSICLNSHFKNIAPDYPVFSVMITEKNRQQAAFEAIRSLSSPNRTKQAVAVLDALELMDADKIYPYNSQYAKHIIELLNKKGHGQVVNRSEIIFDDHGIEFMQPNQYRLEPEWVIAVLVCLVYSGEIILAIPGAKYDASNLNIITQGSFDDLLRFKHIEKPKDWNVQGLKALFEIYDLPPGMVELITTGNEEPVKQLYAKTVEKIRDIIFNSQSINDGLEFWGREVLTKQQMDSLRKSLESAKEFYESVQVFNTPGKLKNFKHSPEDIKQFSEINEEIKKINKIQSFISEHEKNITWLSTAEAMFNSEHDWVKNLRIIQDEIYALIKKTDLDFSSIKQDVNQKIMKLKMEFIDIYSELHLKSRLGVNNDLKKAKLLKDPRLNTLQKLVAIDLMPRQQLSDFQNELVNLKSCFALTEADLEKKPICPNCGFKPNEETAKISSSSILNKLDNNLDSILQSWVDTIINNLDDSTNQANLKLLKQEERKVINKFIKSKELPEPLNDEFINSIGEVFSGLQKVQINTYDLLESLISDGSPITSTEIKNRFEVYIDKLTKGKDISKVRIIIQK